MKYLVLLLKGILTLGLIYFAVKDIDFAHTSEFIYSPKGMLLLGVCISLVLVQTVLAGIRLKPILFLFKYKISSFTGIWLWFLGNFFSQFMISFIGGDTMRVIALARAGVPSGIAMRAIFLDRVLGFVAIQVAFITSLSYVLNLLQTGPFYWAVVSLALISGAMIIGFIGMGFLPKIHTKVKIVDKLLEIGSISKYLFVSKRTSLKILAFSCLLQLCNIVAIYVISNSLGGIISLFQAFAIGSTVMLLAMLPISIGGWGVRESSMVIGFDLIGISSDIALTVSIMIGIAFLIGSLPGAFVLFKKYSSVDYSEDLGLLKDEA